MYRHRNWQGEPIDYPVGKVVCVGSNYQKHIDEIDNKQFSEPVVFIKPETALCNLSQPLSLLSTSGIIHHEIEMAVLIGTTLKQANEMHVAESIAGYAVALDLTLRELQIELKKQGLPWERSKGFDNSCPVSGFIAADDFIGEPQNTLLTLSVNGEIRQQDSTSNMIHKILPLISWMSYCFTLRSGDIVLTGTPHGVNSLQPGDVLTVSFGEYQTETRVL